MTFFKDFINVLSAASISFVLLSAMFAFVCYFNLLGGKLKSAAGYGFVSPFAELGVPFSNSARERRIRELADRSGLDISRLPAVDAPDDARATAQRAITLAREGHVAALIKGSLRN